MSSADDFARFLRTTALVMGIFCLLATALVAVVDPYSLYRFVRSPGFNAVKPLPERYQQQIKMANAKAGGARTMIVGNSRAEVGLDPVSVTRLTGMPAYNLALAGTRIDTARYQLVELQRAGQYPSTLILGLDFLDFPINPDAPRRAEPHREETLIENLAWKVDALFSLTSVTDALRTLQLQHNADAAIMTAQGLSPPLQYNTMARIEGYHSLFQQKATEYARRFVHAPHGLVARDTGASADFDDVDAILQLAVRNKATVHVVIYPYHAQVMALMESAGQAGLLDEWKSMLATRIAALREHYPEADIRLWDFSGYASWQCEKVPAKGDHRSVTKWYWEGGHYKTTLGDLMLERMLRGGGAEGFGFPLNTQTLDADRERLKRERAACLAADPALFDEAADMVKRAAEPA